MTAKFLSWFAAVHQEFSKIWKSIRIREATLGHR